MGRADRDIALQLGVIKIADFGLSKSLAQNEQAAKSQSVLDLNTGTGDDFGNGMEGHQTERCGTQTSPWTCCMLTTVVLLVPVEAGPIRVTCARRQLHSCLKVTGVPSCH